VSQELLGDLLGCQMAVQKCYRIIELACPGTQFVDGWARIPEQEPSCACSRRNFRTRSLPISCIWLTSHELCHLVKLEKLLIHQPYRPFANQLSKYSAFALRFEPECPSALRVHPNETGKQASSRGGST